MRCGVADILYSSTNTFISWLPPPCVRQEGHKPLAEYTRRILSNMWVYGGVCIMPTTRVRVVSIIFIYYMRCGVAQAVTRVGDTPFSLWGQGVRYLLARSLFYASFSVTQPTDVILVSHIQSILLVLWRANLYLVWYFLLPPYGNA